MSDKKPTDKIKRDNWIKIILVAFVAGVLSICTGTAIGLIEFDLSSLHLVLRGLIWIGNVFVCYCLSYLVGMIYKIKFKFYNPIALGLSYTISVVLVILLSGSFDYCYVTSYLSVIGIGGIIFGLYKFYQSRKKIY